MTPTSRCIVLVPVANAIDSDCEDALRELERRGYVVWRVRGYSAIDEEKRGQRELASEGIDIYAK